MIEESLEFAAYGTLLGVSAGVSPGPLSTLVISHTLQHGAKEGMKVAVSPILTDLPIIALGLLLFTNLADLNMALGLVSFFGFLFISFLAWQSVTFQPVEIEFKAVAPRSFTKGMLVNFLSPNPYVFWLGVGVPMVLDAYQSGIVPPIVFALCFFVLIIVSKGLLAVLVGRSRSLLRGAAYIWVMRSLGLLLFGFALKLLYDGLVRLQVLD